MKKISRSIRDARVLECRPMVEAIAVHVHASLPGHIDVEDLIQEGMIGLLDAYEKFDLGRNVSFRSYARHRIMGSMLDSLRDRDWASREMRKFQKKIDVAERALIAMHKRNPTEEEIASKMGISLKKFRQNRVLLSAVTFSLSSRDAAHEDFPDIQIASHEELSQGLELIEEEMSDLIHTLRRSIHLRYWLVIIKYYWEEKTMEEIGEELGVNESRVSQMHKAALKELNDALSDMGFVSFRQFLKSFSR